MSYTRGIQETSLIIGLFSGLRKKIGKNQIGKSLSDTVLGQAFRTEFMSSFLYKPLNVHYVVKVVKVSTVLEYENFHSLIFYRNVC